MKRKTLFRLLPLALLLALLLGSCAGKKATFTFANETYRNEKTGVVYRVASPCYRSATYFEDTFVGTYRPKRGTEIKFYRVEKSDGLLTDEDHLIYYPEGTVLPTLEEMQITVIDLCKQDKITVSFLTIEEETQIASIVRAYTKGSPLPMERIHADVKERYNLVFTAGESELVYELEYLTFADELVIYEPLRDGQIPDTYPGIPADVVTSDGEQVAAFRFGTQLIYDRDAGTCFKVSKLIED